MKKEKFDPLEYIESAFLDTKMREKETEKSAKIPPYLKGDSHPSAKETPPPTETSDAVVEAVKQAQKDAQENNNAVVRLKAKGMRAPRPRKRQAPPKGPVIAPDLERIWQQIPKNLKFLAKVYDDGVTEKYYTSRFRESREDLILRLIDPELNLEETARLLGVCPATVRRYTNRGWLKHHRTNGNQRRFRLSGIVQFVEDFGRNPE
jgi:excisionase family DNA binding protein